MMGGNLDSLLLELKKLVPEILRDAIPNDPLPRLLREVIGHFDVYMMRRNWLGPCPALINDVRNFVGNIKTPFVAPSVVKPFGELLSGIAVRHIHVQLALLGQTRKREIAATQVAIDRTHRIVPKEQVKFRVKRVTKVQFNNHLLCANLFC